MRTEIQQVEVNDGLQTLVVEISAEFLSQKKIFRIRDLPLTYGEEQIDNQVRVLAKEFAKCLRAEQRLDEMRKKGCDPVGRELTIDFDVDAEIDKELNKKHPAEEDSGELDEG